MTAFLFYFAMFFVVVCFLLLFVFCFDVSLHLVWVFGINMGSGCFLTFVTFAVRLFLSYSLSLRVLIPAAGRTGITESESRLLRLEARGGDSTFG